MARNKYNFPFLISWILTITLGSFTYGFGLTYFNSFTTLIYEQYKYKDINVIEDKDIFISVVTTILPVGAVIGSYTIAPFIAKGRRTALFAANTLVVIGSGLTLIENFWTLISGRLLFGWSVGSMSVIGAVFVAEITPTQISGSLATMVNSMIWFGIAVANTIGFIVPYKYNRDNSPNDELKTSKMWRWIFIIPPWIAVFQSALLLIVFKDDSPKYYEQNGNSQKAQQIRNHICQQDDDDEKELIIEKPLPEKHDDLTIGELLSARYRYAVMIGAFWAFLNQGSGITAVLSYSNEIFKQGKEGYDAEFIAKVGTSLIGICMFLTSFVWSAMLARFGRRTILIYGCIGMFASLIASGTISLTGWNLGLVIFTVTYVFFFGTSIGTVMYLYNAEILPPKGMALATVCKWTANIFFSLFSETGFKYMKPLGMYLLFSGICFCGIIVSVFFMKETKGLTKEQLILLYIPKKLKLDPRISTNCSPLPNYSLKGLNNTVSSISSNTMTTAEYK